MTRDPQFLRNLRVSIDQEVYFYHHGFPRGYTYPIDTICIRYIVTSFFISYTRVLVHTKNVMSTSTTFTIRYWTLAKGFASSFILAMVIGGFITMVDTQYRPDTDLVFRFYAKFNPCIVMKFFDHQTWHFSTIFLIFSFLSTCTCVRTHTGVRVD